MQSQLRQLFKATPVLFVIWLVICFGDQVNGQDLQDEASKAIISAYDLDMVAFKRLRENLFQLADEIKQRTDLFGPKPAQDPTLLRPEIRQQIFSIWYPLLDNYLALDAMSDKYSRFYDLKIKKVRKQAFFLTRGVFLTQYRIALEVIAALEQNPLMDTILNEASPALGLPQGLYSHFKYQYLNVIKAGRYAAMEVVAHTYRSGKNFHPDSRLQKWALTDNQVILAAGKGPGPLMTLKNGFSILKRAGESAWLPVQKNVAEWMGKTKVWRPHQSLIRPRQIKIISERLEPGDILLERREWYLTNVGIPGFWTHAALFIGSKAHREMLSKHSEVKAWLGQLGAQNLDELIKRHHPQAYAALQKPYKDGHLPQVIEAISPGVTLTSIQFSAGCDSLAILRPRLSKKERAAAILQAMRYYGRPYDYAFDFTSDNSLVCTELIVKAYLTGKEKNGLKLPLENLMGHMVTPANAFARFLDNTVGTQNQQMDLVLFLDGNEKEKRSVESGLADFRTSWKRPKWHILTQYAQPDTN